MVVVKVLDECGSTPATGTMTQETATEVSKWIRLVKNAKTLSAVLKVWSRLSKELGATTGDIEKLHHREQILALVKESMMKKVVEEGLGEPEGTAPDWLLSPDIIAYGNFSVFNSCIDHVLVGQCFPVIPVSGLDKQPETTVRIADITADSDGEISAFVRREQNGGKKLTTLDGRPLTGSRNSIVLGVPVPSIRNLRGSFLVVALTGAYQEVMASDPNLLGKLPDVIIAVKNGQLNIAWKKGDAILSSRLSQFGSEVGPFEPYSVGDEKE
jgi:hypothetical protein